MLDEIIKEIQKDINKELDKIKPIKKIQKFNKKYKKLFYENNKLTKLGTYIIFIETYAFTQALINTRKEKENESSIYTNTNINI